MPSVDPLRLLQYYLSQSSPPPAQLVGSPLTDPMQPSMNDYAAQERQRYLQVTPPGAPTVQIPFMNPRMSPQAQARTFFALPPAVQQSILQQPSYTEGQKIPSATPGWSDYSSFAPERRAQIEQMFNGAPGRDALGDEILRRALNPPLGPTPESMPAAPLQSPYDTPYNLGFGQYPMALY